MGKIYKVTAKAIAIERYNTSHSTPFDDLEPNDQDGRIDREEEILKAVQDVDDPNDIIITNHARRRIGERAGIKKRAIQRFVNKAFDEGLTEADVSGDFFNYLTKVLESKESVNGVRIYHDCLFLFDGNILITMWTLDAHWIRALKRFI